MGLKHLRKQSSERNGIEIDGKKLSSAEVFELKKALAEQSDFEERAAIMEYDGGLSREEADWNILGGNYDNKGIRG